MNEGPEFLDPELLKDADSTNQRPALSAAAEDLKTTRFAGVLPSAGEPPLPSFPPPSESAPAAAFAAQAAYVAPPSPAQPPRALEPAPRPPKPSWLRALLASTVSAPGTGEGRVDRGVISPHAAGALFASLGLVFAGVALVTGLRGAPADATMAPAVAAALVLARALVALGAGALSFAMLRQAERLLVRAPDAGH
jgi:hypothetical protein